MKNRLFRGWVLLTLLLSPTLWANSVSQVEPEVFQGKTAAAATLRLLPSQSQRSASVNAAYTGKAILALPALTEQEKQHLRQGQRDKAYQIGIGRALPTTTAKTLDISSWQWLAVNGGQAAHFVVQSPAASRIRAQFKTGHWPGGVELRFYIPTNPTQVYGPYTEAHALFWSPSIEGDSLGLELFLPSPLKPADMQLSLEQISHLVVDPATIRLQSTVRASEIDYASCQLDIACAAPKWQTVGKAVARYVFTESDGNSYLCTGTLLADKDIYTQVPYFFTAAHCVNNDTAAASMDMFWLYANSSCGGHDAVLKQSSKGGQLLAADTTLDTALLRLNSTPPTGVTLSGWTTQPLADQQTVTGIHHALGLAQKYAQGAFAGHIRIVDTVDGYIATPDDEGDFSEVSWQQGITAPGSSGSGLWAEQNGTPYLVGSLLGGTSDCSAPAGPDEYTRFDHSLPLFSQWLEIPGTPPNTPSIFSIFSPDQAPSGLMDGIVIARYLQGANGSALTENLTSKSVDLVALQKRLVEAKAKLDIDGDSKTEAAKDGILLVRYLMGLRDAPLIQGLDLTGSTRKTATAINDYLQPLVDPGTTATAQ